MNRRIWLLGLLFVILVFVISGNLFPFLVFASIIFALAIHEAGHAVKLIKYGITIREFGLGIDVISLIKKRPAGPGILTIGPHSLALGTRRIRIPRLVLHPLLIGAYVDHPESEREKLDALPTAAKLEIYSSGAYTNLLMAAILFLMIFWLLFTLYIAHGIYPSKFLLLHLLAGTVTFAILVAWRAFFMRIMASLTAVIGTIALPAIFILLGPAVLTGIIGIVVLAFNAKNIFDVLMIAFAINLSMGIINLIPLGITDGQQILHTLSERVGAPPRINLLMRRMGLIMLVVVLAVSIANDLATYIF